jgi:hypothetical protein
VAREAKLRAWMGKRCSYHPSELPAGINPPDNNERAQVELYDFINDPPEKYFLYIKANSGTYYGASGEATIWTGVKLGHVQFGKTWRGNMGDTRVSVSVYAVNGYVYHGTFFKSSGDYARVKMSVKSKKRLVEKKGGAQ